MQLGELAQGKNPTTFHGVHFSDGGYPSPHLTHRCESNPRGPGFLGLSAWMTMMGLIPCGGAEGPVRGNFLGSP